MFGSDACYTLWNCLKLITDYGTRLGGGAGDVFRHTTGKRWLMDVLYFFAVVICVFNLVAGVVITTFGKMREEMNERIRDTTEVCFICGIDKQVFDRAANDPDGFKIHIRKDHNMWNYIFFIFFIWEQDKDDDDGMEYYVRNSIERMDIDWLPMNKAMRLDQAASVDEQMRFEFKQRLAQSKDLINARMKKMQINIMTVLEQLNLALKKDHAREGMADDDELGGLGGLLRATQSGAHGDGEDFFVVESASISAINRPRRLHLEVLEVCGLLHVPAPRFESVFCRVECDEGSYTIAPEHFEAAMGRIVLCPDKVLVCADCMPRDERIVRIDVCLAAGASDSEPETVVASLELPLAELIEGEGVLSERLFLPAAGSDDLLSLVLHPTASQAD